MFVSRVPAPEPYEDEAVTNEELDKLNRKLELLKKKKRQLEQQQQQTIRPVPAVPVYEQENYRDPNRSIFSPSAYPSAPSLAAYLPNYYVPPASGDWPHGVCGCFEGKYAERNCTFTCCCVHVCCEPLGPCCAWASMAAAVGVENTDEVFRRQACAYCLIDTGNRCMNSQNDQANACGGALSAVGYAALVWIRTTARLQLAQWLGLSNAQSNFLRACCCVVCCNPLATIQELCDIEVSGVP